MLTNIEVATVRDRTFLMVQWLTYQVAWQPSILQCTVKSMSILSTMLNTWHARKKGEPALIQTEEQRTHYIHLEKSAVGVTWVCKIILPWRKHRAIWQEGEREREREYTVHKEISLSQPSTLPSLYKHHKAPIVVAFQSEEDPDLLPWKRVGQLRDIRILWISQ